jgi:hypothetical protein
MVLIDIPISLENSARVRKLDAIQKPPHNMTFLDRFALIGGSQRRGMRVRERCHKNQNHILPIFLQPANLERVTKFIPFSGNLGPMSFLIVLSRGLLAFAGEMSVLFLVPLRR